MEALAKYPKMIDLGRTA